MSIQSGSLVAIPNWFKGWVLPILLIITWWYSTAYKLVDTNFLVPPDLVIQAARDMLDQGLIWDNLYISLWRMLGGFTAGVLSGIAFGLLLGFSVWADRLATPTFSAFRQISVFAWIPLISLCFGLDESSKIFFIALVAFLPAVVNTYEGIKSVPNNFIEVGKVYQFTIWTTLSRIILPAAAPSILMGVELAAVYAWLGTIGSEYLLTSSGGIGALMNSAQQTFMMDQVFVGIILSGLIGFAVTLLLNALRHHILRWQKTH